MTDVHEVRSASRFPGFLLPAALFVVLFCVAVVLAQIAPSRVTSGVYQVFVGEGAAVIPTEALTCSRAADTATCTTSVNGRQLTIDVRYIGWPEPGPCAARYGDRAVPCMPVFGFYGHTSQTIWITDDLGLSGTQLADLHAAAPWWRVTNELTMAMLILVCALSLAAGAASFLLFRHLRPVSPNLRLGLVFGTGVASLAFFAGTGLLFAPPGSGELPMLMASPFALLAATAMASWQWVLASAGGRRVVTTVVATVAVALYTIVTMLVFLIQSGFDD